MNQKAVTVEDVLIPVGDDIMLILKGSEIMVSDYPTTSGKYFYEYQDYRGIISKHKIAILV